jgi:hypothetical protein
MRRSSELDALLNICRREELEAATTTEVGLRTVRVPPVEPEGHLIAEIEAPDGSVARPIVRDAFVWATLARQLHAEVGGDLVEIERRALLVATGRYKHDLLVADEPRTYRSGGPVVVDPTTGIALVGLFLRSRGIGTYLYDTFAQHQMSPESQRLVARKGLPNSKATIFTSRPSTSGCSITHSWRCWRSFSPRLAQPNGLGLGRRCAEDTEDHLTCHSSPFSVNLAGDLKGAVDVSDTDRLSRSLGSGR